MRKGLLIFAAVALVLGVGLLAHEISLTKADQVTVTTLNVPEGASVHVDTDLRQGTVHFLVQTENGDVCADRELTRSYRYAVKAFRTEEYTVTVTYHRAVGQTEVYLTDEAGERIYP